MSDVPVDEKLLCTENPFIQNIAEIRMNHIENRTKSVPRYWNNVAKPLE